MALNFGSHAVAAPDPGPPSTNASPAARSINALGVDLLSKGTAAGANALLSPYSIQEALAMTFAGAAGDTRTEMATVLHYPADDEAALHRSFAALDKSLQEVARTTAEQAERAKKRGGPSEPVTLTVANRLFGQQGYDFRPSFLSLVKDTYGAPVQVLDFHASAPAAIREINQWVDQQTHDRIRDLVPPDGLNKDTRLVLINAIYLKAPWAEEFKTSATRPAAFHINGRDPQDVASMTRQGQLGYARPDDFTAVTIPYSGGDIQFLILLPHETNGLAALEAKLTPDLLASCASLSPSEVILHLPKFKVEPPLLKLSKALRALGMKSAFDDPKGSANFDRMAPRQPNDYLFISEVFHKTFLALDEKGTEAAAATAVAMMRATAMMPPKAKPIEVRVDHPFLYAIQHRPTGACLFLGRMMDPR
jgi:serpin B